MSGIHAPWNWGDITVGQGPEVANDRFSIDVSSNQILFTFTQTGLFTINDSPNGPVFTDFAGTINPIRGVTLQTNMHGLSRSDITWTADSISIDFSGGSFTPSTYVRVNVTFDIYKWEGRAGNEVVQGSRYDDYLIGHKGADRLTGGDGADTFVFVTGDSGKTKLQADFITDFDPSEFDIIDLDRWDANSKLVGTQEFTFIGTQAFGKEAGQLRFQKNGGETWVQGDTNGDGKFDFLIRLKGSVTLTEDHFYL